jgi:hypothetical protein
MKIKCLLLVLIFSCTALTAQKWKLKRYEALIGVSSVNYFGDIGGSPTENNWFGIKDIQLLQTRPSIYVGARYKIRHNIAVKANFTFGFMSGSDEGTYHQTGPNDRNWAFTARIFEPSAQFEYSILSEEYRYRTAALFNKKGMLNNYSKFNVYVFGGVGAVKAWPKPNDEMVNSPVYEPDYKSFGLVIPAGLGLKYVISSYWSMGAEFGGRWTTNDYLDAYGNPLFSKYNDIYYFAVVNAIYRIKTSRRGYPIIFGPRRRSFI